MSRTMFFSSFGILIFAVNAGAKPERIVGGETTTIDQYPYIVQVEKFDEWSGWNQGCGANILTSLWVMSAAHCFEGVFYATETTRLRAGTTFRNIGGDVRYIELERNHPDYGKAAKNDADISVVKLATPFIWSDTVKPGTIVPQNFVLPDNHPVVFAGWGHLKWGGSYTIHLQHVNIFTINNELCAKRYRNLDIGDVTKNMICAGLLDVGGRDACQGDSGGPLLAQGENGLVIVGVVSWGYRCANGTYPGLSTSVASYTNWIIENAR